nr:immunoglobulin light chain junction region [Macaca mulatta]MOV72316.1 immunoglobulin light chain junction region [Macaca mulatta]MOV72511.1 immunoglobulin light chain junction region [Macaca mulatta]MOV72566.1 immunoglobulin light chain junction region [Macaca mulatta]MOV72620.1 immunoglobulin light chain junction region [Macaca mulatta]
DYYCFVYYSGTQFF